MFPKDSFLAILRIAHAPPSSPWEAPTEAALLCFAAQPDNEARAAPKLNVAAFYEALGVLDCLAIVSANQRLKSLEMAVSVDDICPVFWHH